MFLRSASLIITSSMMACLAIAAVALRFWARRAKRIALGADDVFATVGLVGLSLASSMTILLSIVRSWPLGCVYAILSEPRGFGSVITSSISILVPSQVIRWHGSYVGMGRWVKSLAAHSTRVTESL